MEISKNWYSRNVSHDTDFQEIRQVEAPTRFKEPSIMDEEQMGSFSRRSEESDDLSDLLASKKVTLDGFPSKNEKKIIFELLKISSSYLRQS